MPEHNLKQALTAERLREVVNYNPETGEFRFRISRGCKTAGDLANADHGDGYVSIGIDGQRYLAHQLAWLYQTGSFAVELIDHKDLDRSNNRWINLRIASHRENRCNVPVRSDNQLKLKGVSPCKGRYRAVIHLNGKQKHLGVFDTPELAHAAYAAASIEVHGEFGRIA